MSAPQKIDQTQEDVSLHRLSCQLNPHHPLLILSAHIAWDVLDHEFSQKYQSEKGHPPKPVRLMCGLLMLQHLHGLSDDAVVRQWVENPYWQSFCGYDYLQWKMPIDPSSLTRWRRRLGVEGLDKILAQTVLVSQSCDMVKAEELAHIIVDTTVMEKAVTFPTDSKLLFKARQQLVKMAKEQGIRLRQSYARVGRSAYTMACRYGHAGQFKRMAKQVKRLKTYLGRVMRDIERKVESSVTLSLFENLITKSKRLLAQTKESANKLYSLHAPEVECIAKGKAHKRYEFGCKVALAITHTQGLVVSAQARHGNPYDGHTLDQTLTHAAKITQGCIRTVYADRGYKGHGVTQTTVYLSGQKKLSRPLIKALKRRAAIEPHIGHMKSEGKLGRNYLKGTLGDQLNALLVAVGHNLRLILNFIRSLFVFILVLLKKDFFQIRSKSNFRC